MRAAPSRWHPAGLRSFNRMLAGAHAMAARGIRGSRNATLRWVSQPPWKRSLVLTLDNTDLHVSVHPEFP
jgi:hypothetical protein